MKIALALDDSLDYPDGVQQYVLAIGRWYVEQGHEVHYLTSTTTRTDIDNIHNLAKNTEVSFNKNTLRTPRPVSQKKLTEFMQGHNFDVLHVQMPYSPFFAGKLVLAVPKETAVIGTFHIAPFSKREELLGKLLGKVSRASLKRFDAICSVSKPAQAFAKTAFGISSTIVPNAVNLAGFQNASNAKKSGYVIRIVFLGRLVERKGCIWFLRAIDKLCREISIKQRLEVRIGGRGPLLERMRTFVAQHDLAGVVAFDGFIDETEKPQYLSNADIAAFPSLGGESFGISLIEAMATGRSVVLAGNNPGYRQVMQGNPQQLIDPQDTIRFSNTLRYYIDNPHERAKSIRWQNEIIQPYDVSVVGNTMLRLYSEASH